VGEVFGLRRICPGQFGVDFTGVGHTLVRSPVLDQLLLIHDKKAMEPKERTVRGKEHYLVLSSKHKGIQEYEIAARISEESMKAKFPGHRVYLRNKNLQRIPHQGRGSIMWLPLERAVVVVISAYWGKAYVRQLFPPIKKGKYQVDLSQDGWYLQQQQGRPLIPFNHQVRPRQLSSTGNVIPLLDANGNSKCNVEGPDVVIMNETVPESVMQWLKKNPWRKLDIQTNMDTAQPIPGQVGVVYVQVLDPTVQFHEMRDQKGKIGVCSVPVGCPIYGHSDRYVVVNQIRYPGYNT
jgi:hypothetical protein